MDTIQFSVHEFVTLMGILHERVRDGDGVPASSVWHKWKARYKEVDTQLEKLDMMDRADMLFDGKIKFADVPKTDIQEIMTLVEAHAAHEQSLIDDKDPDADPDELEIWQTLYARLETSLDWEG
ncbi:MAG: hypothetical protein NWR87_06730 [Rhodospirillales bacterium]|jgi:hypothetical protein|nr:hypothetical protein [Rhodospirillales bacterium]